MVAKMNFSPSALPLQTVMNNIKNVNKNGLDLRPTYQRGYVWNEDFQIKLIYSVIKGYPIGNISIRNLETPNNINAKSEVVDGQQRLQTLFNFINNDLELVGEYAKKIILEIKSYLVDLDDPKTKKLLKKLQYKGKVSIKYSDLPDDVKDNIKAYPISISNISNASTEQITEYFNFLQNQERLRAGEIINSIPDTILEKYLEQINDKERFLNIISYSDNRREFDKIFYSLIGLFDKKISFGVKDKVVQEYVSTKDSELDGLALEYTKNMIGIINLITDNFEDSLVNSNKRLIKFLLLIAAIEPQYFKDSLEDKLILLENINNKLSAFNSGKKDIIPETFLGYSDDEIERYRLVYLVTKGAHPFERIQERVRILTTLK